MAKRKRVEEEDDEEKEAEDWCFVCKDGGDLMICDKKDCPKAYHPECVNKAGSASTSNKLWTCKWHQCLVCRRPSNLHCYCCPNAVCRKCTKKAKFERVKGNYGFCNDCLKLAVLVEDKMDVDSEGESVDFKDRETYEGLFREYYEIIKDKEGFDADAIHDAKKKLGDSDRSSSEADDGGEEAEHYCPSSDSDGNRRKRHRKGKKSSSNSQNKSAPKKMVFLTWGSEALISFLNSVGLSTTEELTPDDVERIILRYVKENNLTHPTKRRKVVCDNKLRSILRRKEVNKNSIPKILESHFAANQEESEDDEGYSGAGDEDEKIKMIGEVEKEPKVDKDKRKVEGDKLEVESDKRKVNNDITEEEVLVDKPPSCFAAIVPENIKLVYLKKSLVLELSKQPQEFENKVIGSFVRVNPNPHEKRSRRIFQLEQVTGVKSLSVGEENSEVVLRVTNVPNDISSNMLCDGDFSEEECKDLLNKVKAGQLKKLKVVELQKKVRVLHQDITNHWIPRELAILQHHIDWSNLKGYRREMFEYLDRQKKLQNPSEVDKMLQTIPVVIPDSGELDDPSEGPAEDVENESEENGTPQELAPGIVAEEKEQSKVEQPLQTTADEENIFKPCLEQDLETQPHNVPSVDKLDESLFGNDWMEEANIAVTAVMDIDDEEKDRERIQHIDAILDNERSQVPANDEKDRERLQRVDAILENENACVQPIDAKPKVATCDGVKLETDENENACVPVMADDEKDRIQPIDAKPKVATEDPEAVAKPEQI